MAELKIVRGGDVGKEDFEKFLKDLELFLGVFQPQVLANWMDRDKSNLGKKLNGTESITRKDLREFYASVGSVIDKLKSGVSPYQIELEMDTSEAEEPEHFKRNIWEEIRLIKAILKEHDDAIKELKPGMKPPAKGHGNENQ